MSALAILEETRRHGLRLSINGDKLHVEPLPPPKTLERLRAAKPQLMAALKLEAAAAEVCAGLDNVTPADVSAALAPEDIADWQSGAFDVKALRGFVLALSATRYRELGIAPPGWTKYATCERCGPVFLWAEVKVAGCPWCWNRVHAVKIPRPLAPDSEVA